MKKHFLFLSLALFSLFSSACSQGPESETDPNAPVFKWEEETHDFGQVPQGIPVTTRYYFTNIGKSPLLISEAKKTCGCTTPDWTKDPVAPGQKGFVEATYNAATPGQFSKAILVVSNATTAPVSLTIKGEVLKKEDVDFHDKNMLDSPSGH